MSANLTTNMGGVLGSRISQGLRTSTANAKTSTDVSITNTRAGWQQRFGAMQMISVAPNQYAMFGSWSGSSTTVAP